MTEEKRVVPSYIQQDEKKHELSGITKNSVMGRAAYELILEMPEYYSTL